MAGTKFDAVVATPREGRFNKNAARRVRVSGLIPAVVYGHGAVSTYDLIPLVAFRTIWVLSSDPMTAMPSAAPIWRTVVFAPLAAPACSFGMSLRTRKSAWKIRQ